MKPNSNTHRILEVHTQDLTPTRESNGRGTRILPISHSVPHSSSNLGFVKEAALVSHRCSSVSHGLQRFYTADLDHGLSTVFLAESHLHYQQESLPPASCKAHLAEA